MWWSSRTREILGQTYRHFNDIYNWCKTCSTCTTRKILSPKQRAALVTMSAGYPTQIIAVGHTILYYGVGDYFTH